MNYLVGWRTAKQLKKTNISWNEFNKALFYIMLGAVLQHIIYFIIIKAGYIEIYK